MLPRALGNAKDGVPSAFPTGKQNGDFFKIHISLIEDILNLEQTTKQIIILYSEISSPFCIRSFEV